MSLVDRSYSSGPIGTYARRLGINRQTWRAGQTIGRAVKSWMSRKRKAAPASRAPAGKRVKKDSGIQKGTVVNDGAGGQYSSFFLKKKNYLEDSVSKELAPVRSVLNNAVQVKSAMGLQAVSCPLILYNVTDVTTLNADIGDGAATNARLCLQKVVADVHISNIYLSNVQVDIYDCIARKDLSTGVVANPLLAWSQGDTDEGAASEYTKIGATPFQTELFNTYWRVAKTTRVTLGAGQLHRHHVAMDVFRAMNYSYYNNAGYGFADLTYSTLLVIRGSPANDTTTQTQVSIGECGVNIVYAKEYLTKMLYLNQAIVKDHSSLLATGFTVGEQVINIGGTTVVSNAEG